MAIGESEPMFLNSIDGFGEMKVKYFIAKHMRDIIMEVGSKNVVQLITDIAFVCKTTCMLIEVEFPSIYWIPCVVHTLNLALKNICAAKNTEKIVIFIINVLGSHKLLMILPLLQTLLWSAL